MKKIIKFSKIFLLITTIFSYIASPISVLADEIISMPLNMQLVEVDTENDGYVDYYEVNYESLVDEYDTTKTYEIKFDTTFTYNDDVTVNDTHSIFVTGTELNEGSNYNINPISVYYDGFYVLNITVYDGTLSVYEDSYTFEYTTLKGLTGKLNELVPTTEEVGSETIGNYDVTLEGEYVQKLNVLTGELTPNGNYRIMYEEGIYSDIMTGEVLRETSINGTITDFTGKLSGMYSYMDVITIEEVILTENNEYEVLNSYVYTYNANLKYCSDNDELFTNIYNISFEDGYMLVNAKGLYDTERVITIRELVDLLTETEITLEVLDDEGNILDLTNDEILDSEVKNNYVINFINGATASYVIIVKGDTNSDNEFNNKDLLGVMEGYLDEENMPSMDMYNALVNEKEEDEENSDVNIENTEEETEDVETIKEEFGTITFEDVMFTNELLKENGNIEKDELDNTGLSLNFGDVKSNDAEIYVGDNFEIDILINSEDVLDYIDGIDAAITTSDNLKLSDIKYNELFNGVHNEYGRVVGAGQELTNDSIVMTLVFNVVGDGIATIEFGGNVSKYLNISEFETITKEIEIIRRSSINNLSSLNSNIGTFDVAFDKDVTVYTLTVPYDTVSVMLSGALEDTLSEVDGLIEYTLTEDKTTAIINVTAEDGTVKTYTVYIVKDAAPVISYPVVYYYSANNYLKSLEVDGYEVIFDKYTSEYKITVKNDVTSLDIKALAEDSTARVEITGNENFEEGENVVVVTITAENGATREYKLIVNKESKKDVTTTEESNTAEKIVIIILIILVVLGLLYLIFKKDDDDSEIIVKKEDNTNSSNKNNSNKNNNNKNVNNSRNNKKK